MGKLSGKQVLIVEDEFFIADQLARSLADAGAHVVGPAPTCEQACRMLAGCRIDLAVLDVRLDDAPAYPVADLLRQRKIPFVFATGFDVRSVRPEYRDIPHWEKPYDERELIHALTHLVA